MAPATLRLELFVGDLRESLEFYRRVLGFKDVGQHADGYSPLERDAVHLALNLRAELPREHPIQRDGDERLGGDVEIVLEVDGVGYYWRVTSRA